MTQFTCVDPPSTPILIGPELHGQLQNGGHLLIANGATRNVETVISPAGVFRRLCGRSQTAIRTRVHGGGDSHGTHRIPPTT